MRVVQSQRNCRRISGLPCYSTILPLGLVNPAGLEQGLNKLSAWDGMFSPVSTRIPKGVHATASCSAALSSHVPANLLLVATPREVAHSYSGPSECSHQLCQTAVGARCAAALSATRCLNFFEFGAAFDLHVHWKAGRSTIAAPNPTASLARRKSDRDAALAAPTFHTTLRHRKN